MQEEQLDVYKRQALVIGLALVIVIPVVKWHMRQEAAKIIQEDQQKIFKEAFDKMCIRDRSLHC